MSRIRNSDRGDHLHAAFTLIELLVVVAIIALLLSILLPSLSNAREQGRRAKCAANLHSIALGAASYMTLTNRYVHPQLFPEQCSEGPFVFDDVARRLSGEHTMGGGEESGSWDCPKAMKKRKTWKDPNRQGWDQRYQFISYGANDWGLGEYNFGINGGGKPGLTTGMLELLPQFVNSPNAPNWAWWGVREASVSMPAKFICFMDSNRDGLWDQVAAQDMRDWCWGNGEYPGAIHPRKNRWGVNVSFFDSHVEWYTTFKDPDLNRKAGDKLKVDGIMLSDFGSDWNVRDPWRMMWSRDYQVHHEITHD